MTENEAVEKMARALYLAYWGCDHEATNNTWEGALECEQSDYRTVARLALTSHPAVDALREIVAFETDMERRGCPSSVGLVWFENARTVLASLPKDTDAQR